jgi:hypothetical protein
MAWNRQECTCGMAMIRTDRDDILEEIYITETREIWHCQSCGRNILRSRFVNEDIFDIRELKHGEAETKFK